MHEIEVTSLIDGNMKSLNFIATGYMQLAEDHKSTLKGLVENAEERIKSIDEKSILTRLVEAETSIGGIERRITVLIGALEKKEINGSDLTKIEDRIKQIKADKRRDCKVKGKGSTSRWKC